MGLRLAAGRFMFAVWALRGRLAETKRPALTRFLSRAVAAGGVLFLVEGVLLGWFAGHLVPAGREIDFMLGPDNWMKSAQWVAGVCLIVIGLAGLQAGLSFTGRRRFGAYMAIILWLSLLAVGVTLIYGGARFGAPVLLAGGIVNAVYGLLLCVLLGLCWYTLDPLGLHREIERRVVPK